MQAVICDTGKVISGKTLKEIRSKLNGMLTIEGHRGLTAITDTGAEIHVELYDGQDYIISADGRTIYSTARK